VSLGVLNPPKEEWPSRGPGIEHEKGRGNLRMGENSQEPRKFLILDVAGGKKRE